MKHIHGASGLCCELRRQAIERAEAAENEAELLQEDLIVVKKEIEQLKLENAGLLGELQALLDACGLSNREVT